MPLPVVLTTAKQHRRKATVIDTWVPAGGGTFLFRQESTQRGEAEVGMSSTQTPPPPKTPLWCVDWWCGGEFRCEDRRGRCHFANGKMTGPSGRPVPTRSIGVRWVTPQSRQSRASRLRATPAAALTVHRTVIHYRGDASLTPQGELFRAVEDAGPYEFY